MQFEILAQHIQPPWSGTPIDIRSAIDFAIWSGLNFGSKNSSDNGIHVSLSSSSLEKKGKTSIEKY
jgi:hypothetical protein